MRASWPGSLPKSDTKMLSGLHLLDDRHVGQTLGLGLERQMRDIIEKT